MRACHASFAVGNLELWWPQTGSGVVFLYLWYWSIIFIYNESERLIHGTPIRCWLGSLFVYAVVFAGLKSIKCQIFYSIQKRWSLRRPMDSSLYWCSRCSRCLQTQGSSSKTREKRGRCRGCGGLIGNRRDEVEKRPTNYIFNLENCKMISRKVVDQFFLSLVQILDFSRSRNFSRNIITYWSRLIRVGPQIFFKKIFSGTFLPWLWWTTLYQVQ